MCNNRHGDEQISGYRDRRVKAVLSGCVRFPHPPELSQIRHATFLRRLGRLNPFTWICKPGMFFKPVTKNLETPTVHQICNIYTNIDDDRCWSTPRLYQPDEVKPCDIPLELRIPTTE
jgi:hypothetical protein